MGRRIQFGQFAVAAVDRVLLLQPGDFIERGGRGFQLLWRAIGIEQNVKVGRHRRGPKHQRGTTTRGSCVTESVRELLASRFDLTAQRAT